MSSEFDEHYHCLSKVTYLSIIPATRQTYVLGEQRDRIYEPYLCHYCGYYHIGRVRKRYYEILNSYNERHQCCTIDLKELLMADIVNTQGPLVESIVQQVSEGKLTPQEAQEKVAYDCYEKRQSNNSPGDSEGDWNEAAILPNEAAKTLKNSSFSW